MRRLLTIVALTMLSLPVASRAQVSLGLRTGYGIPSGDAEKDAKLSDGMKSQIPIQLDVSYKLTPSIAVGGYFSYGFGSAGDALSPVCDTSGVSCSLSDMRLGLQAFYGFMPAKSWNPWLGLAVGYEWAKFSLEANGVKGSFTYSGFEFATLQAGVDFKVAGKFALGPYASYGLGQYSSVSSSGASAGATMGDKAMHEWIQFGIRGTFDL
jgi:hypothetical protein